MVVVEVVAGRQAVRRAARMTHTNKECRPHTCPRTTERWAEILESHIKTPSAVTYARSDWVLRVNTILSRCGRGRYLSGIDSHVFLPMMTAFCLLSSCVLAVFSLKNFISSGTRHGMVPMAILIGEDTFGHKLVGDRYLSVQPRNQALSPLQSTIRSS